VRLLRGATASECNSSCNQINIQLDLVISMSRLHFVLVSISQVIN